MRWSWFVGFMMYIQACICAAIDNNTCGNYDSAGCAYIPGYVTTGLLSQRDVAYNVSVDQLTYLGINMTSAVFSEFEYTTEAVRVFQRVLGSGYRSIYLNLYWNSENGEFQLCPAKVPDSGDKDTVHRVKSQYGTFNCQRNFTLEDVLEEISTYIEATDTDIGVNLLLLRFYLYTLDDKSPRKSANAPIDVTSRIKNYLYQRMYTPTDLRNDREYDHTYGVDGKSSKGFPTAHRVLLELKDRIMVSASHVNLDRDKHDIGLDDSIIFDIDKDYSGPDYLDQGANFTSVTSDRITDLCHANATEFLSSINSTTSRTWRTILDNSDHPFTNDSIRDFVQCGYSPVVNNEVTSMADLANPVDASLWTWALKQPSWNHPQGSSNQKEPKAYKCAVLDSDGWRVVNCYDKYKVLCRANEMAYNFEVGYEESNYFEAGNQCGGGSSFSVPRTALQNKAAMLTLNDSLPVWIDFNTISVDNCWVTGGPYASCPYQPISTNRNGLKKLLVAALMAFVLVVLILLLRLDKVPLKKHQSRWRRLVNKFSEEEYEGVPA